MVKQQEIKPEEREISAAAAADVTAVAEICARLQSAYRTIVLSAVPAGYKDSCR